MKKLFILLISILTLSSQDKSFIMFGYNMNKYDISGEAPFSTGEEPTFRVGLKAVTSDWFHMDVEYVSYAAMTELEDDFLNYKQTVLAKTHYVGLSPKLALTLFDFVYVEGGVQLAYAISSTTEITTEDNGVKSKETNSKNETTSFRTAFVGEAGFYLPFGILVSGFYEYNNEEEKFDGTDAKARLITVGARIGISF